LVDGKLTPAVVLAQHTVGQPAAAGQQQQQWRHCDCTISQVKSNHLSLSASEF
jgi:hypothetical protein